MKTNRPIYSCILATVGMLVMSLKTGAFYDPNLQRWPNRDPIGEMGGLNLSAFVLNNPVIWVDAWGREIPIQLLPVSFQERSLMCWGGQLVPMIPAKVPRISPDYHCSQAHEESHKEDWKKRYGDDVCNGVADGLLPVGGDGYEEFLRQSECKAHMAGKECRERLKPSCPMFFTFQLKINTAVDDKVLNQNKCCEQ